MAVTGSSGKTSTKDLLAVLLAELGPTVAAEQSFNSEIGVPLTVCRIDEGTRYLVVEMGARGLGHLAYLTSVAPPTCRVVLNVGYAHASEFGSMEAVATAKSELVQALSGDGVAVLNLDDPRVAAMAALAPGPCWARAPPVTRGPPSEPRTSSSTPAGGPAFRLVSSVAGAEGSARVRLGLHGEHHVANALAAAAVALHLGLAPQRVAELLSSAVAGEQVADGGRRARRRRHGRQRRLQRQPRLGARRPQGLVSMAGDRPHLGGARRDARAGGRSPRACTTRSAGWPSASTSLSSSPWARARAPSTPER